MRGLSDEEITAKRSQIMDEVRSMLGDDVEFIDSYLKTEHAVMSPLKCLSKSISLLADADCVYFGDGWREFRGCNIEHDCAEKYGIRIIKD